MAYDITHLLRFLDTFTVRFVAQVTFNTHLSCFLLFTLFSSLICVVRDCARHGGWLLLKCSAIGIGFNGAETNCGIARILGILLMNSWDKQIYFLATTIICSLSTLNLHTCNIVFYTSPRLYNHSLLKLSVVSSFYSGKQPLVNQKAFTTLTTTHIL